MKLVVLFSVVVPFLSRLVTSSAKTLTAKELVDKLEHLHAGDKPLVRYTVSDTTYDRQPDGCKDLSDLVDTVKGGETTELKMTAAQVIAVCLNERPQHRDVVGELEGFHDAVVKLLKDAPAEASELIYIAVFSHFSNHDGFNQASAVDGLIDIVMNKESDSKSLMWALAALQNLAASYCDGYCEYYWGNPDEEEEGEEGEYSENEEEEAEPYTPTLMASEEFSIDSSDVRAHIIEYEGFLDRLDELVCSSVALGKHGNPFPHDSTNDVNHFSIVPWAAAGLVKNLAIDMSSHEHLESAVACLCWMTRSEDDLEYGKAGTALYHLDREDSCHFRDLPPPENQTEQDEEYPPVELCVDHFWFSDDGHKACYNLEEDEECSLADEHGMLASLACCVCGGGTKHEEPVYGSNLSQGEL